MREKQKTHSHRHFKLTSHHSGRKNHHRSPIRVTTEQHTRHVSRGHCTSSPPLVAMPFQCHPPSESQANGMGTKGGKRCANQNSSDTTISLEADGNTIHRTSGLHVPTSNAVQGEEASRGMAIGVETPPGIRFDGTIVMPVKIHQLKSLAKNHLQNHSLLELSKILTSRRIRRPGTEADHRPSVFPFFLSASHAACRTEDRHACPRPFPQSPSSLSFLLLIFFPLFPFLFLPFSSLPYFPSFLSSLPFSFSFLPPWPSARFFFFLVKRLLPFSPTVPGLLHLSHCPTFQRTRAPGPCTLHPAPLHSAPQRWSPGAAPPGHAQRRRLARACPRGPGLPHPHSHQSPALARPCPTPLPTRRDAAPARARSPRPPPTSAPRCARDTTTAHRARHARALTSLARRGHHAQCASTPPRRADNSPTAHRPRASPLEHATASLFASPCEPGPATPRTPSSTSLRHRPVLLPVPEHPGRH